MLRTMRRYKRGEVEKIILRTLLVRGLVVAVLTLPGLGGVLALF